MQCFLNQHCRFLAALAIIRDLMNTHETPAIFFHQPYQDLPMIRNAP